MRCERLYRSKASHVDENEGENGRINGAARLSLPLLTTCRLTLVPAKHRALYLAEFKNISVYASAILAKPAPPTPRALKPPRSRPPNSVSYLIYVSVFEPADFPTHATDSYLSRDASTQGQPRFLCSFLYISGFLRLSAHADLYRALYIAYFSAL